MLGRRLLSSSSSILAGVNKSARRGRVNQATTINPTPLRASSLHYKAATAADDDEVAAVVANRRTDVLVLGCGVAGSSAALKAAEQGLQVTMVTSATDPLDCNSYWAQGGIIYKAKDDSPALLAQDIFSAGAGVNDPQAVNKLAVEGPACVEDLLLRLAPVPFDRTKDGGLALCLEASHNRARIIHWRDHTGRAITESLQQVCTTGQLLKSLVSVVAVVPCLQPLTLLLYNIQKHNPPLGRGNASQHPSFIWHDCG